MNTHRLKIICMYILLTVNAVLLSTLNTQAQSYTTWYNNAQERIDTLRKGDFGIQIFDKSGQPFEGQVSVHLVKHEFPFGIAFDLYDTPGIMGYTYSTEETILADTDAEIYQTERFNDYLDYAIPVESGKNYEITLKFAEIYFSTGGSRIFDVLVEGQLFLDDFDIFSAAGGKDIALDTSITVTATHNTISIELTASLDNAAIKGIVIKEEGGSNITRINCGGQALTTIDGNDYVSEEGMFDPEVFTTATTEQWMKAAMYKYFNYGACGNSFKWSGIQPQHTEPDYTNFEHAVQWTQSVDWELRAHTLLWGGNDDHSMPAWVRELPTPEAITDTCKMRVIREMTRYRGIIKEYDVINEPLTGHADWLRNTVGDSIIWNCFKWAHSADPDAELYINDYNVEYNWGQAEEYRDLILQVKENGGPVTGVGVQAHFWDCCRPGIDELVSNLNIVAEAGLPIRLTEYDWGTDLNENQQAADFIKVLTIAFSHPSVNGMICWGLHDRGAWRENTGFFDSTYHPKLAADTLLYYTKTKWATNFDSTIYGDTMAFNAYYGNYEIEVLFNDTIKVFSIPCLEEYVDSVFILYEEDAYLKGPVLLSAELEGDEMVKLTFDKPIEPVSVKKSDFKFFSNYSIGIDDIQVNPDNSSELSMTLSAAVTAGDYISVSYFPGELAGTDGSLASAFGPEGLYNPGLETGKIISVAADEFIKVYPNPASDIINIVCESAPFQMKLINSLGAEVYSGSSSSNELQIDVNKFKSGIYLIKVIDTHHNMNIRKIILK